MSVRWSRLCLGLIVLATTVWSSTASGRRASSPSAASQSSASWTARLEELRPAQPLAYFELAEEISDAGTLPSDRGLARHLYALAGALDPPHLGRSACLALADLEENEQAKRRLLALASLLGAGESSLATPLQAPAANGAGAPAAALAVAQAFSHYRAGNGAQALAALRTPGATELLKQHERLIPGGLNRFLEDCKVYKGQLRPTLSSGDITRMLRFELAILTGPERSWSSELLLSAGQPLVEVDPDRLEESLGVDASRPYYRNGRWVER